MRLIESRIVLAVRDLQASTSFYKDVLGCQDVGPDPSTGWCFLSRDGFTVMLGECSDVAPASEIGDHSYVAYVVVDNVDDLYAEVVQRGGVWFSAPETQPWGMRECALRTPDGHRFRFGQAVE